MYDREKNDLEQLDKFDRWLVVSYWRGLLWKQSIRRIPTPIRFGLINFLITTLLELIVRIPIKKDMMAVVAIWTTSYSLTTAICLLLPLKRKTSHWVR